MRYKLSKIRLDTNFRLPKKDAGLRRLKVYGKDYNTLLEVSQAFGISYEYLLKSVNQKKLTVQRAIKKYKGNIKFGGRVYRSYIHLGDAYGMCVERIYNRLGKGWDLERALTQPIRLVTGDKTKDHNGVEFMSKAQMCRHYGITTSAFNSRIESGWGLEDALTKPYEPFKLLKNPADVAIDHLGNEYRSIIAMCEHYGIHHTVYRRRLRRGWLQEDALTKPLNERTIFGGTPRGVN